VTLAVVDQPDKYCTTRGKQSQNLGCGSCHLGGRQSTPNIFRLVMVSYHANCNSYSYNGWGVNSNMKIFGMLGYRVGFTPRNLPLNLA